MDSLSPVQNGRATLSDVPIGRLGSFGTEPGTFSVFEEPSRPWEYVFASDAIALRTRENGEASLQLSPPTGDTVLPFLGERDFPHALVWLGLSGNRWITAFGRSMGGEMTPGWRLECHYSPTETLWVGSSKTLQVKTRWSIASNEPAAWMECEVRNLGNSRVKIELVRAIRPKMAPAMAKVWDVPSNYQSMWYGDEGPGSFRLDIRSPQGIAAQRKSLFVFMDIQPDSVETSFERFIGCGSWHSPSLLKSSEVAPSNDRRFCVAKPPVCVARRAITVSKNDTFKTVMVLSTDARSKRLLDENVRRSDLKLSKEKQDRLMRCRSIRTADRRFDAYVTSFLPLQLEWVSHLDRGWPSGLRGSRDAAQDASGFLAFHPERAKKRLFELLSCQRTDGWFPRQYSINEGSHDHDFRDYVDAGFWVWELFWDYLTVTQDFGSLDVSLPWLDSDEPTNVFDHVARIWDFYLDPENRGVHGLCKIREGDWNDSVNGAGIQGRGESVMLSCQVVFGLFQAAVLADRFPLRARISGESLRKAADDLEKCIRDSALNSAGFVNGVFTDAGRWAFSNRDCDGETRPCVPANAFALIAGVAFGQAADSILRALASLKGPYGWRLFYPPFSDVSPVPDLGRLGSGDMVPGFGENGTVYNHGSQGFLARALACVGEGDSLFDVLKSMLPYDQDIHPVTVAKTAPYAIVNHWKESLGNEGEGGDAFLSGAVSTAYRLVYAQLLGWRPGLNSITLDPCIPSSWKSLKGEIEFLHYRITIEVLNPNGYCHGVSSIRVDGASIQPVDSEERNVHRRLVAIPFRCLFAKDHGSLTVEITLGEPTFTGDQTDEKRELICK